MTRYFIALLTVCSFFTQPISADHYDLGSGCDFNHEGCGYEHSYCVPSLLKVSLGVFGSIAMIAGIIAIGNSGNSHQ